MTPDGGTTAPGVGEAASLEPRPVFGKTKMSLSGDGLYTEESGGMTRTYIPQDSDGEFSLAVGEGDNQITYIFRWSGSELDLYLSGNKLNRSANRRSGDGWHSITLLSYQDEDGEMRYGLLGRLGSPYKFILLGDKEHPGFETRPAPDELFVEDGKLKGHFNGKTFTMDASGRMPASVCQ